MKKKNKQETKFVPNKLYSLMKKNKTALILLGIVLSLLLVPIIIFLTFFNNDPVRKPLVNKPMECSNCTNTECPAKKTGTCNCNKEVTGGCPNRVGN